MSEFAKQAVSIGATLPTDHQRFLLGLICDGMGLVWNPRAAVQPTQCPGCKRCGK